ncbi:hypothetical protein TRFO_17712 [Tritrichomonas foetus]|uniref:Myb-like DNA-binding domain containing protein n=1 Tax=Tritrichomonas foetus TaxID=1144522 RepID=A0A1J4KNG2_9EUKA|nr:hypothetical protein TRFO_17712 [Tritrichomonas foetus]|eukprot:OHT12440.1 hypothetical protein TRFO_17712 [Tritrichomonas foetus]
MSENLNAFIPQVHKVKTKKPRKKFTDEEDKILIELVHEIGSKKWKAISKAMYGRTPRQCHDRYCNYLVPGYFNGQWTCEEDDKLYFKYHQYGPRWSYFTQFFACRSAIALKNRWNYFVSKRDSVSENQIYQKSDSNNQSNDILRVLNISQYLNSGDNRHISLLSNDANSTINIKIHDKIKEKMNDDLNGKMFHEMSPKVSKQEHVEWEIVQSSDYNCESDCDRKENNDVDFSSILDPDSSKINDYNTNYYDACNSLPLIKDMDLYYF